jgi:hypothetical protein
MSSGVASIGASTPETEMNFACRWDIDATPARHFANACSRPGFAAVLFAALFGFLERALPLVFADFFDFAMIVNRYFNVESIM